jgi:hypothetical protein
MKNLFFKLKCLYSAIKMAVYEWKEICWKVDLDEVVCCIPTSYSPCGCGGDTHRQRLEWNYFLLSKHEEPVTVNFKYGDKNE